MGTWPLRAGTRGATRPTGYPVCHASAPSVPSAQGCPQPWLAMALSTGGDCAKVPGNPTAYAQAGPPLAVGQAQPGKGCQQAVVGQRHTAAGGAGLALDPEQTGPSRQQERWACVPTAYIP